MKPVAFFAGLSATFLVFAIPFLLTYDLVKP